LGEIPFIHFGDMVFTRFPGCTDSRANSRTDTTKNMMPPALKVFGGEGIIKVTGQALVTNTYI